MEKDIWIIFQWWGTLFLIGAAAFPLTRALFKGWFDEGYFFGKAVGMALVSWIIFALGTIRILPFTTTSIWLSLATVFIIGIAVNRKQKPKFKFFIIEELFFFAALLFWSWIKAHEPSIHGLEKFMDFGFTKSILNAQYFPPPDMWYAGFPINYYYFGHLVMAVVTKLSGLNLTYTFNLMLASLFALTLTMSFSIGYQLKGLFSGILTAFLVTLAGNMQTLYAFTPGYPGDQVRPFWELGFRFPQGLTAYWYANATRFIPFTIHEFPSYSFVVSDVHGHVLSLPFVLLAIALLVAMYTSIKPIQVVFYGFLAGVLLMTNALDGPIYAGLFAVIFLRKNWKFVALVALAAGAASLPFITHFQSFVHGVAINCPLGFLANTKLGPFLFEGVEKCQHSPLWMMALLWGFFIYCGGWLVYKRRTAYEKLLVIFFFFSLALIVFPEFFYFKDIYPMHFRSNTMFKLGYQAFILFGIASGYVITKLIKNKLFFILLIPQLFLVSIYPIFSVRSYFGELKDYKGLDGVAWLKQQYPDNFLAMQWLSKQPPGVLVEADGDSYTDYNQFSAFTGMPTIVGWAVHEWLWRGSYDVVSPRREDVRKIYESKDLAEIKQILEKYKVRYIFVGTLERQKFKNLSEARLAKIGKEVFRSGGTVIYQIQ